MAGGRVAAETAVQRETLLVAEVGRSTGEGVETRGDL